MIKTSTSLCGKLASTFLFTLSRLHQEVHLFETSNTLAGTYRTINPRTKSFPMFFNRVVSPTVCVLTIATAGGAGRKIFSTDLNISGIWVASTLVSTARENDPSAANESSTARTGDGCVGLYIGFLISCVGVPGGAA